LEEAMPITGLEEIVVRYFATKLLDEGSKLIGAAFSQLKEEVESVVPDGASLPAVCLIGLGRCGTNVCENVRDILIQSRHSDDGEAQELGLVARVKYWIVKEQKDANAFLKVSSEPMIIAIDLDKASYERFSRQPKQYDRFLSVQLDWTGGAGNVQILGEYQARKLLTLDPNTVDSENWKNVFAYLIDSASLEINPTRVFIYIFSTGGGTGSGMCSEFGLSQRAARAVRKSDVLTIRKTDTDLGSSSTRKDDQGSSLGFKRAPVFSCGIGILPEIPDFEAVHEAVHLNSGRLLCKFLALVGDERDDAEDNNKEKSIIPWNCLMLLSNESVIGKLQVENAPEISAFEFERITNIYAAKHIFNLLSAQVTAADVSPEDWEAFGISTNERLTLDATDLAASLYGLTAIAFDQADPRSINKSFSLESIFVNSLRPAEIVEKESLQFVRGVSVLPGEREAYESLFAAEEPAIIADLLARVPMFSQARSILTVISIPEKFKPRATDVQRLKKANTVVFHNAMIFRLALVRSAGPHVALTTFISGNSVVLTNECIALLASYIRRCFSKDVSAAKQLDDIVLAIHDTGADTVLQGGSSLLEPLLIEHERLSEYTAGPFDDLKEPHETSFKALHGESFIGVNDLRLDRQDVIRALEAVALTVKYSQKRHGKPDVLSPSARRITAVIRVQENLQA
jgi:hypothetical protein